MWFSIGTDAEHDASDGQVADNVVDPAEADDPGDEPIEGFNDELPVEPEVVLIEDPEVVELESSDEEMPEQEGTVSCSDDATDGSNLQKHCSSLSDGGSLREEEEVMEKGIFIVMVVMRKRM